MQQLGSAVLMVKPCFDSMPVNLRLEYYCNGKLISTHEDRGKALIPFMLFSSAETSEFRKSDEDTILRPKQTVPGADLYNNATGQSNVTQCMPRSTLPLEDMPSSSSVFIIVGRVLHYG